MHGTLILIGGGALHHHAPHWARAAGMKVVCTDEDARAPARPGVDLFHALAAEDVDGHVDLANTLSRTSSFVAAYSSSDRGLRSMAAIGEATGHSTVSLVGVERALDGPTAHATWRKNAIPCDERMVENCLEVNGFFRDGSFQPAGIFERGSFEGNGGGVAWGWQPSSLKENEVRPVYELLESGARALGIEVGPVMGTVTLGEPHLLALRPRFHEDVRTAYVSPLVYGKSPLQAWFAHLLDAGGPFDEMPLAPQRCAGWLAILPEHEGTFCGIEGMDQARRLPGIAGLVCGRHPFEITDLFDERAVCGYLWAGGRSKVEVEHRLRSARAALRVNIARTGAA
ncbi:MAG: hypothetical protein CMJ89_19055 [Planctomycetes bacterium]|jgi:hypothetical protein|nr:hypothetical protein [Planctomycetota bacterium]